MSFRNFLNLEVMSLRIIDENIDQMTEKNYRDEFYPLKICNEIPFENNLAHGWIAVTMMINYLENLLNTIIRDCIKNDEETVLRQNIEEKLKTATEYYHVDTTGINDSEYWASYKKLSKVRNSLVHYKDNDVGECGMGFPEVIIGDVNLTDYFTKSNMEKAKDDLLILCTRIVTKLGLYINEHSQLFDCDGFHDTQYIPHIICEKQSNEDYVGKVSWSN